VWVNCCSASGEITDLSGASPKSGYSDYLAQPAGIRPFRVRNISPRNALRLEEQPKFLVSRGQSTRRRTTLAIPLTRRRNPSQVTVL
jgi:hypothetical protein